MFAEMASWTLAMRDQEVTLLAMLAFAAMGLALGMDKMLTTSSRRVRERREFEQSRREIAAYIAEGSTSSEDGERLLRCNPLAPTRD